MSMIGWKYIFSIYGDLLINSPKHKPNDILHKHILGSEIWTFCAMAKSVSGIQAHTKIAQQVQPGKNAGHYVRLFKVF